MYYLIVQERSEDDIGDVLRNYGLLVLLLVGLPVAFLYNAYRQPSPPSKSETEVLNI